MTVASAELHKAIRDAWISSGADNVFRSYWSPAEKDLYPSLNDTEATPHQPFPYCVFEVGPGNVVARMTGHNKQEVHQIVDFITTFSIYTKSVSNYSAKELAAILMETVLACYGGHPTTKAQELSIVHGSFLQTQFQWDQGVRVGDDEHRWLVEYVFTLDGYFRI